MQVDDMIEDAIGALIEADERMSAFPEDQQRAWRALVSGLVGVAQALGESHRQMSAKLDRLNLNSSVRGQRAEPLALGME